MIKPSIIPDAEELPLHKWKMIQFAELDLFDDPDEMLKNIGMAPPDIRLFRKWQKGMLNKEPCPQEMDWKG